MVVTCACPVGFKNLITLPGRTQGPRHRDDRARPVSSVVIVSVEFFTSTHSQRIRIHEPFTGRRPNARQCVRRVVRKSPPALTMPPARTEGDRS